MNEIYNYCRDLLIASSISGKASFLIKRNAFKILLLALFFAFGSKNVYSQTTLISPSGDGGFENGSTFASNGWTNSSSANNPWIIGTAVASAPIAGNSAYISNDGVSNLYTPANNASNFFWRDVTVPAGETVVKLSFNWICQGESTWDNWQVFYAPTTVVPTGSTTHPGNGATNVPAGIAGATWLGNGNLLGTVQTATIYLPASLAGTTFRLIFHWKNDVDGTQPPASIDNISLISRIPVAPDAAPITFSATLVSQNGITVNWVDNSTNETDFRVYRSTDNVNFVQIGANVASTSSASIGTAYLSSQTGLSAGTLYYFKIVSVVEAESAPLTGSEITLNGATYYWTGATGGAWNTFANWNTAADGSGTAPTAWSVSDSHIIDGAGSLAGGDLTISVDRTSFTVGQILISSNTNLTLASSATTTRTITISGGPGNDFVIDAGSSLNLIHATQAVAFAFSGTGNIGLIAGIYTAGGSTSNNLNTTGGTGTLFSVASTAIVTSNLNISTAGFVGNAATLVFQNGSNWIHQNSTTVNYIPTATWQATATATLNGNTTGTGLTSGSTILGNLIVNTTASTATLSAFTTNVRTIQGNLTINNTGTGRFRAVTSGLLTINGNLNVNAGIFDVGSSSGAGVIVKGNTTVALGATLDLNRNILQNEGNMVNNGSVLSSETTTTNSTINFIGSTTPQSFSGTGTFTGRVSSFGVSNPSGLTISTPVLTQRVNLFTGNITGSGNITIGTGLALGAAVQIGSASNTNSGGNFDVSPIFNLGTGAYSLLYLGETTARTTGFEVPLSRSVNTLILDNLNGLTISSGSIEVLTGLTLTNGVVTSTTANHIIHGSATAAGTLTGGSATSYISGPIERTINNANTASNYVLYPVGKAGVYTPVLLAPTTTSASKFSVESFNSNTGTANASIIGLSSTRRFEALPISGTFTDINVILSDANILATSIPVQASSASGQYTNAFGSVATAVAGVTTQSNTAVTSANYSGFLSYATSNSCSGTPSPGNTVASANVICLGESITLSLQNSTSGSGVTYAWESSTDGSIYTAISGEINASLLVAPTTSTYYRCNVTCATNTGTSTAVQITFANAIATSTPATRCGTGTVSLAATSNAGSIINWYDALSGGNLVGTGNTLVTPSISSTTPYYAAAESSTSGSATIGAGVTLTGATAQPTAFCNRWPNYWSQTIYTASELSAAGVRAGNINSIAYNIASLGDGATNANFTVKMGNTAGTSFANTTFLSSATYTTVYGPSTYTHSATGWQTISFSTPFVWDGVSNIVVNVTHDGANATNNSQTYFTATTDNKVLWVNSYTGTTTTGATSLNRINIKFNGQVACSSPRVAVSATVTTPPALSIDAPTAVTCESVATSTVNLTSIVSDYNTYTWSPATNVSGDETMGWTFNPSVSTTYTLTATQTSGSLCSSTVSFAIIVNPLPSVMTISPVTGSVCPDAIQSLVASGGTIGVQGKIGSGTSTNTLSTPFRGYFGGSKSQALYTASELTALGMVAGKKINTIGFVALSGTPIVLNSFTINAGFVSNTNLGAAFIAGANNIVLAPVNYTPTTGIGNLDFVLSTPLVWDGISNLLVETCFNNNNGGGSAANSISLESSTVASGLNTYLSQDNNPTVCSNANATTATTTRPNLRMYILEATTLSWSPITNLYTDAAATTPYSSENIATVYFKSNTAAPVATYTVNATSSLGCIRPASVGVTVNALPMVMTVAQVACTPNTVDLTATGVTSGSDTGLTFTYFTDDAATLVYATPTTAVAGTYYIKGTNTNGCSAVASVVVTINISTSSSSSITACDSYFWAANGTTYSANGIYTNVTTNAAGCPDTATLNLTINNSTTTTETQVACDSFTWNGTTYQTGGVYTFSSVNTAGCTNVATLNLTINSTPAPTGAATQSLSSLLTVGDIVVVGSNVVWYASSADAASGSFPLSNATVLANTTYFATQTIAGCVSTTSLAVTITTLANQDFDMTQFSYYPNPVIDLLNVSYSQDMTNVKVFNMIGQQLLSKDVNATTTQIDMSSYAIGAYFIQVSTGNAMKTVRVIKK
ncbi:Secretion system C-terminal sorting domain [Flavobacteriaceae bacterium]